MPASLCGCGLSAQAAAPVASASEDGGEQRAVITFRRHHQMWCWFRGWRQSPQLPSSAVAHDCTGAAGRAGMELQRLTPGSLRCWCGSCNICPGVGIQQSVPRALLARCVAGRKNRIARSLERPSHGSLSRSLELAAEHAVSGLQPGACFHQSEREGLRQDRITEFAARSGQHRCKSLAGRRR